MITYQVKQNIVWKWILIELVLLIISYVGREYDLLRIISIIGVATGLFVGLFYTIFTPTLLGEYIRFRETDDSFDIEYLNKDGSIRKVKSILVQELVSFSFYDHSSQVLRQSRIVLRSAEDVTKLTLLYKRKVREKELQTSAIVDMILKKIQINNTQHSHQFIERTPSFFSSKAGLYSIIAIIVAFAIAIIFSGANTEKLTLAAFSLAVIAVALLLRRNTELNEIEKSNNNV